MKAFKSGQAIEVEMYDFKQMKSHWVPGIFIKKVQATDMPYRYEVEVNGRSLEGFQAAHPDCIRPIKKH